MKDLSFFLLKNALGSKMKKGFKNSCTGDDSTSTATNLPPPPQQPRPIVGSPNYYNYHHHHTREKSQPTFEEMILQLELEERAARLDGEIVRHRMSCVNSSDILRSARNALNQYPRFSLDGKDAMYRASFRTNMIPAAAATANQGRRLRKSTATDVYEEEEIVGRRINHNQFPTTVAGERVVWCRPGVVGKLMGLEAIPIPVRRSCRSRLNPAMINGEHNNGKNHNHHHHHPLPGCRWREEEIRSGSCSNSNYLKPEIRRGDHRRRHHLNGESGWPIRRFQ